MTSRNTNGASAWDTLTKLPSGPVAGDECGPVRLVEVCDFDDRGCRTQVVTEVDDARALFANWGGGVLPDGMMALLHRVLFYGDHMDNVRDLAHLTGLKVLVEGKDMADSG